MTTDELPEPFDTISVLFDGGDLEDVNVYTADQMLAAIAAERDEIFRLQCSHSKLYGELQAAKEALAAERKKYEHT